MLPCLPLQLQHRGNPAEERAIQEQVLRYVSASNLPDLFHLACLRETENMGKLATLLLFHDNAMLHVLHPAAAEPKGGQKTRTAAAVTRTKQDQQKAARLVVQLLKSCIAHDNVSMGKQLAAVPAASHIGKPKCWLAQHILCYSTECYFHVGPGNQSGLPAWAGQLSQLLD